MKILLCNLPIRNKATEFPPVACTILYNVLKNAGYHPFFYDLDVKRPSGNELSQFFKKEQYDIVGISAVVSTSYKYAKFLSGIIKESSPKTQVILGGNLAAAYEIILPKCAVDLCVIGRGEKTLLRLLKHWQENNDFRANDALAKIEGIAFLNSDRKCKFTGCQDFIDKDYEEQPDYDLLDKFSDINNYITDPLNTPDFAHDRRSYAPERKGKKMATIFTSKGCINRCTFCHRWLKGYRTIPVEKIMTSVKNLINKYNVGFFSISDECFGENKQWLEEFIRAIKPQDVLFQIGGARVSMIKNDSTIISRLKEAGLTAIYFGIESGSEKILEIMEKNVSREENLEAIKICSKAGVYTVIQLVIGMPGENDQTINETIEFVKNATANSTTSTLSINYLQALPGTPTYEFLRHRGLLGNSIEDEERYLIRVSDKNAAEFEQYINVSEEPLSKVKLWKPRIAFENEIHWFKHHHWKLADKTDRGYSNNNTLFGRFLIFWIIDILGDVFWKSLLFKYRISLYGIKRSLFITLGLISEEERLAFKVDGRSLREILNNR